MQELKVGRTLQIGKALQKDKEHHGLEVLSLVGNFAESGALWSRSGGQIALRAVITWWSRWFYACRCIGGPT